MNKKIFLITFCCSIFLLSSCSKPKKTTESKSSTEAILLSASDLTTVQASNVADTFQATGELKPSLEAAISSEVEGQVLAVYADAGDHVKAGQLLATLDSQDLRDQLANSRENLQKAQARAQLSGITLSRKKQAYAEDLIAKQDLDSANTDHQVNLREIASAKTQVSLSQTSLEKARIKAPISGIISNKLLKTGELAQPGKTLFEIVQINPLKVELAIPSKYLPSIKLGQTIDLSISSFPEQTFKAKVTKVNPVADESTRSVMVTASVPNPQEKLKANLFVNCEIKSSEMRKSILVPKEALLGSKEEGYAVYVFQPEAKKVTRQQVEAQQSSREGTLYEITKGLELGEQLVTVPLNTEASEAPATVLKGE